MKGVSVLFKTATGIIYTIPGIICFVNYVYPVNISKLILLAVCEVIASAVIILSFIYKEKIQSKTQKQIFNSTVICFASLLIFTVFFLLFNSNYITNTFNGEKILLPLDYKSQLAELRETASKHGEEIGEYLGKDSLIQKINFCCKTEMVFSEFIYIALSSLIFNSLIILFIRLGIYYKDVEE